MADKLQPPPPPSWSGVEPGAKKVVKELPSRLYDIYGRFSQQEAERKVAELKRSISIHADDLAWFRQQGQSASAEQSLRVLQAARSQLKDAKVALTQLKQGRPPVAPTGVPTKRLPDFLLSLPGVLGLRVEEGEPVLLVRTRLCFERSYYDMGDFEIVLRALDGRPPVRLSRPGTLPHQGHYYYHGYDFCFGNSSGEITSLWQQLQPAEAVHLMVACMNGVNSTTGKFDMDRTYRRIARIDPAIEAGPHHKYRQLS